MIQTFFATKKADDAHGLAVWWWFLSNGLDPLVVPAYQWVSVDTDAMTATYQVLQTGLQGRLIPSPDWHKGGGWAKREVTAPIYHPTIYGLPDAAEVSA